MTYTLNEEFSRPVLQRVTLDVDDEQIAIARPVHDHWRVVLHPGIGFDVSSESLAREILGWIGKRVGASSVLHGSEEGEAPIGSVWHSEYNDSLYRRTAAGWEFYLPPWISVSHIIPEAFPLWRRKQKEKIVSCSQVSDDHVD